MRHQKLSAFLKTVAIIFIIIYAIVAIYLIVNKTEIWVVGLTLIVECPIVLIMLSLSAILEQTDRSTTSLEIIEKNLLKQSEKLEKMIDAPVQTAASAVSKKSSDTVQIICPSCGTKQRSDRTRCYQCGASFTTETA